MTFQNGITPETLEYLAEAVCIVHYAHRRRLTKVTAPLMNTLDPCPFQPDSTRAYREWRARKLDAYPSSVVELMVPIGELAAPSTEECAAVVAACRRANLAVVTTRPGGVDKAAVRDFGRYFGLHALDANLHADPDGISALHVAEAGERRDYIPYTNRALNWHTDGYYNEPGQWVHAFIIFCAQDAAEGGENQLLDHEIAYILLRDADPRLIEALMHPRALTIPANIEQGVEIRGEETGPVFSVDSKRGSLHMRYSARTRNVRWRDDPMTRAAREFLVDLWENGSAHAYHHRLMPGQGIICNNVLHSRTAFCDDPANGRTRLMYRARYYDRIAGTETTRGCAGLSMNAPMTV